MFFVTRGFVCSRLKVSEWASYRMVRSTRLSLISSDDVIGILNGAAKGEQRLDHIPSDIVTGKELAEATGIPLRKICAWTRRTRRPIPHFRINKQTTRYRLSSVGEWIESQCGRRKRNG